ncbi:unnamed protein product [Symbiodinium pilosum]|uniref:C3H1-type domain-containing protein n=1 Tax=Symbiodinium pilosum TaxID=2952 RepID=A0A812PAN0_SYMPI|nr:unnamed protein product [Symbiodinium pilosum]
MATPGFSASTWPCTGMQPVIVQCGWILEVVFQSRDVAKKAMQDAAIASFLRLPCPRFAVLPSLARGEAKTNHWRSVHRIVPVEGPLEGREGHAKLERNFLCCATSMNHRVSRRRQRWQTPRHSEMVNSQQDWAMRTQIFPVKLRKVYTGILKHFDAQRKCGYIHSPDAEVTNGADIGKQDIYAFKDVLERGKACVGDTLAFPLHWSPKGQPQASSPLIRISARKSYAHTGNFRLSPADMSGRQAGMIECAEVNQVFGRTVYVGPSLAATLTPGTFVAFNCYLMSLPAAFARAPLDGTNVPVCSHAIMVETNFISPGPELNETKTAEGFDRNPGIRDLVSADADGEVCRFFVQAGWCKYGDSCRHKHVQGGKGAAAPREICAFFQKSGWCRFGDACKHAHVLGSAPPPPPPMAPCGPGPNMGQVPGGMMPMAPMAPMGPMGPMY